MVALLLCFVVLGGARAAATAAVLAELGQSGLADLRACGSVSGRLEKGGTQDVPVPDRRRPFLGAVVWLWYCRAHGGGVGAA